MKDFDPKMTTNAEIISSFSPYVINLHIVYQRHIELWKEVDLVHKQYGTNKDEEIGAKVKVAMSEIMEEIKKDPAHLRKIPRYVRSGYKWVLDSSNQPVKSEYQPFFDVKKGELFMAPVDEQLNPILQERKDSSSSDWIHVSLLPYRLISRTAFTADEQAFILDAGYVDRVLIMQNN